MALHASWPVTLFSLFGMSLVHEDVAIIAAGMLVLECDMPYGMALAALYLGVISGDFAIYGAGAVVRYFPWARRLIIKKPVRAAKFWLKKHMIVSVAACRFLPGILFPTYAACGWFGLSFRKFALTTMTTSAVYVPVAFTLAVLLKTWIFPTLTWEAWAIMLAFVLLIALVSSRRSRWSALGKIISTADHIKDHHRLHEPAGIVTHSGMPPLEDLPRKVASAERIPPVLFYVPYVLNWLRLAARYRSMTLPALANPLIEAGGFWGESKSECLRLIKPEHSEYVARFEAMIKDSSRDGEGLASQVCQAMKKLDLGFPVIVKPDIGWQGFGVRLIHDEQELAEYVSRYPAGGTLIVQEYVSCDGEACVLYSRYPGEAHGRIASLTLRYFPHVVGDGARTVAELIRDDPRASFKMGFHLGENPLHYGQLSHDMESVPAPGEVVRLSVIGSIRVGGLYRDGCGFITPAMTERMDEIARGIPEFYYGRFDIRFKSMDRLQQGEDFKIIEVNGAGSESIHIWDPGKNLLDVYRILFESESELFKIGAMNRARGFKTISLREGLACSRKQQRLIPMYPPSG